MEISAYESQVLKFFNDLSLAIQERERDYKNNVNRFFSDLSFRYEIFYQLKEQTDLYLSSEFSVFNLIAPDENKISTILADMFNPKGSHGQKTIFLDEFIEILKHDTMDMKIKNSAIPKNTSSVSVIRELTTDEARRIDIVLKFEEGVIIGIENKAWRAPDQKKQIEHYFDYLERQVGPERIALIYLPGIRENPSSDSISPDKLETLLNRKQFAILPYSTGIKEWLIRCYEKCRSDRYRYFLLDFLDYIDMHFKEVGYGQERND